MPPAQPRSPLPFGREARIGILVVAYNAEAHLAATLDRIPVGFRHRISEIFVCDDASQDDTYLVGLAYKERAHDLPLTIIRNEKNLGYGGNQKAGYALAATHDLDIIVLLHADGQYAPELIPDMIAPIEDGDADAVFGSRMITRGGALKGGMPLYKFVGNKILTFFENLALGTRLSEFHSGYRAYNVHALAELSLAPTSDGFNFDTQIIVELVDKKKRIAEIPIPTYYGDEISYVNGMKYAAEVLQDVLTYRVRTPGAPPPRAGLFLGAALASIALLAVLVREVYLFADDYLFIGQARQSNLSWDYLSEGLFQHFSPVSRLADLGGAHALPGNLWLVWVVSVVLGTVIVASVSLLMLAIFGKTWPALLGSLLLSTSLTLLPLMTWWTAAFNMMPAIAGFMVCFAGIVLVARGRSRWWGVVAIVGYGVGILDWELALLAPGAAAIWLLLFHSRVTSRPFGASLRRTCWIWAALAIMAIAWVVNFVLHYYQPAGQAALWDDLHGFWIAMARTTLPTIVGFHDVHNIWFSNAGTVVALAVSACLVIHTLLSRVGAWRGWVFALTAWLLPVTAVLLNRVASWGPGVATHLIYYFLPVLLVIIGGLEAWRSPLRSGRAPLRARTRVATTWAASALVVVMIAGYAVSAGAVRNDITGSPTYLPMLSRSAARMLAEKGAFTVINSDSSLVPVDFRPYGRLDRVVDVAGLPLTFDGVNPPYAVASANGALYDAQVDWQQTQLVTESVPGRFEILDSADVAFIPGQGACFTTVDRDSRVSWLLDTPITDAHIVVRSSVRVDAATPERVYTSPRLGDDFEPANEDLNKTWRPGSEGTLDTVAGSTVAVIVIARFAPRTRICLHSIQVGVVTSTLFDKPSK